MIAQNSRLRTKEHYLNSALRQINSLEDEIHQTQNILSPFHANLPLLPPEFLNLKHKHSELSRRYNLLKLQKKRFLQTLGFQTLRDALETFSTFQSKISLLETKNSALSKSSTTLNLENSDLQSKVLLLTTQISDSANHYETEIRNLRTEIDEASVNQNAIEFELNERIAILKLQNDRLCRARMRSNTKLRTLADQLAERALAIEALDSELTSVKLEIQEDVKIRNRIDNLEIENENLRREKEISEQERKQNLEESGEMISQMEERIKVLMNENETLRQKVTVFVRKTKQTEEESVVKVSQMEEQTQNLVNENKTLRQ
jgi:chromosome segregation ATPase